MTVGRKKGSAKTGGRKKGAPNKQSSELRQYARQYTTEAVDALVSVLRDKATPQAKVAAANALLDRAYGKPSQYIQNETVEHDPIDNIDFENMTDEQLEALASLPTITATTTTTTTTTRKRSRSVQCEPDTGSETGTG